MIGNNEIKTFENNMFGTIRTIMIDDNIWFVAKDVSDILGYAQTSNMMKRIDDEDFISSVLDGMNAKSILINESGLYASIIGSKLDSAKQFKHWVTSEVLPSIRSNGYYINKKDSAILSIINSKNDIEMALAIKNYGEIIEQPLLETIDKQKPMVELAELRISAYGCYTITDVNKTFRFKRGRLTNYAKSKGMIHKTLPEVNQKGEGIFKIYSKEGKYNQIGITEEGLQWVKENKDIIANYKD